MKPDFHFKPRELEILKLITKALSKKAIDGKLVISIHTLNTYVKSLHAKTNTHLWSALVLLQLIILQVRQMMIRMEKLQWRECSCKYEYSVAGTLSHF